MKTAVIYARYSSDNQTEQSIEGQLHVCEEYAKQNDIPVGPRSWKWCWKYMCILNWYNRY